jgi:hypothetical protein
MLAEEMCLVFFYIVMLPSQRNMRLLIFVVAEEVFNINVNSSIILSCTSYVGFKAVSMTVTKSTILLEKDTSVKAIFQCFHVGIFLGLFSPED